MIKKAKLKVTVTYWFSPIDKNNFIKNDLPDLSNRKNELLEKYYS